jgi:hypothetical protein
MLLGDLTALEDLDITNINMAADALQCAIPLIGNLTRLCLGGAAESSDLAPHGLPSLSAMKGLRILHFLTQRSTQGTQSVELWLLTCLQACARVVELAVPAAFYRHMAETIAQGTVDVSARLRLVPLNP